MNPTKLRQFLGARNKIWLSGFGIRTNSKAFSQAARISTYRNSTCTNKTMENTTSKLFFSTIKNESDTKNVEKDDLISAAKDTTDLETTKVDSEEIAEENEYIVKELYPELYPENVLESSAKNNDELGENNGDLAELELEQADQDWYIGKSFLVPEFESQDESTPLWKRKYEESNSVNKDKVQILFSKYDQSTILSVILKTLEENSGHVALIDVAQRCEWTDKMIIAEANSVSHMKAIAQELLTNVKSLLKKTDPGLANYETRADGWDSNDWLALDFGSVIVHIMTKEARESYDLEGLWKNSSNKSVSSEDMLVNENNDLGVNSREGRSI
ncbi:Mitochondrial assembly of ribosomal large subunit protein 1 [Zancudomyces culisetae]|uniref:Mitochondrial assembly of ribosomal large subunit protein 1 n=1 Tax=Zancudomyces culisetae TaxID=1213189 RepID=A0A1R1PCQ7_ZANCU|nr:Mitochondrial assembly of ribosomal large subunit protein 1 [Zancudomyces culisetae]|eukprot:OMH78632.1 Mitochondrial assembly of ribosomal large subunit protein 1 [Zancudomyces culisetae]